MHNYLDFEYAEDAEGVGTFEAMSSTWPEQVAAVQREIAEVLNWAFEAFGSQCGPVSEGYEWDYDLHGVQEFTAPETIRYNAVTRRFTVQAGAPGKPRHTVTLAVSGTQDFCAAFRERFGLE